ncbi:MAG: YmdB family metallophosphoesterase [Spirochaetaceae bacterium]|jgi:metallophosphoesterase (TIGR00282 family)|nr:YmdB family metallophosphoesterase [Spirochaetaceae bacterium]
METLRILMIGDVVGEPGLEALERRLPALIARYSAGFTVVNGENAAAGFGLTGETLDRILAAGADAVTGGNHIWEKRDFWPVLDSGQPVLRPANYPPEVPGRGILRLEKAGVLLTVINLQGREQMRPIDCPFRCFDRLYGETAAAGPASGTKPEPSIILVDFHAESSREKEALAYYLDGRASVVAGTHTHVQTADERILPGGTAYITDLGMTGAKNGVIGMDPRICLDRARTHIAYRMECAPGPETLIQGIAVTLNEQGRAAAVERILDNP